ncbi:MAG: class I SAM-dependent methyltransferase [Candidatus Woesearchaeota archaeon]|jgi:predicted RNA methylase
MIFEYFSIFIVGIIIVLLFINAYISFFGVAPFVPTPMRSVHEVLKHAKIKKGDILYDLGAGDGRFLHFAEKDYGAHAIGYESNPMVFAYALLKRWFCGWKGKIIYSKFQKKDMSDANIIVCYMMPHSLKHLQSFFEKQIAGGTRIVSYAFTIGTLKPKKVIPKDTKNKISQILIYEK